MWAKLYLSLNLVFQSAVLLTREPLSVPTRFNDAQTKHLPFLLQEVVRQFVERYIVEQTSVGSETAAEVTRKDIMAIRTDVAIFK